MGCSLIGCEALSLGPPPWSGCSGSAFWVPLYLAGAHFFSGQLTLRLHRDLLIQILRLTGGGASVGILSINILIGQGGQEVVGRREEVSRFDRKKVVSSKGDVGS